MPYRWRFGPFEVDEIEHRLWRDGRVIALTRKSFALLAALLSRAGQLVTKVELFDSVWAGRDASDAALARALRELRIALGDAATEPTYVQTVHGLGLRFIAAVDTVAPAGNTGSPGAGSGGAAPQRLAGRDREVAPQRLAGRDHDVAQLRDAIASVDAGERRFVFVSGPAGIGKTTLVEAVLALGGTQPRWTAAGRCVQQYGAAEPYLPLLEAFEGLAAQLGAPVLRDHLLRVAPGWLAQLPWLASDVAPDVMQQALLGQSPARLLREFAQALEMLARDRTLVLWLEDLHWCDHASVDALAFLAGRRERARLLVVASVRPPQVAQPPVPVLRLMRELQSRGACISIALAPLDAVAVAQLMRSCVPVPPPSVSDALAALVHRRSEGNPLFARAITTDLLHAGLIVRAADGWQLAGQASDVDRCLPLTLRQLVDVQLGALDDDDRRVIEAAAVAGPSFTADEVAAAIESNVVAVEARCTRMSPGGGLLRSSSQVEWPPRSLRSLPPEGAVSGFGRPGASDGPPRSLRSLPPEGAVSGFGRPGASDGPDGSVSAGFAFVHALYWEAVIEQVPEARRAAWHKRMAERVEQAYGAASDTVAVQLATRFEAGGEPGRAIGYLLTAADTALSRFAYREAVALLHHALTLASRLPPSRSARVTMDVLLPLGAALIATSGYAASDVQSVYERALALGRELDAPKDLQRALRGLWNVALVRADLSRAAELARELMQRAQSGGHQDAAQAFDAHAKLGQTFLHLGQLAQAQEHLGTALVMPLDAAARTRETPRVAGYLAWVKWYRGWPDQALSAADQACELAQAAGNPHSRAFALGFAGFVHVFRGEWDLAESRAHAQAALAAEHGLVYWHDWSGLLHGLVAAVGRRDHAGLAVVRAALDAFTAAGATVGFAHFQCEYAAACLVHLEVDAARNTLAAARDLVARSGNAYHEPEIHRLEAQALLIERGEAAIDEAGRGFERAFDLARDQGAVALQVRTLTGFVGAARHLGHPCTAQQAQLAQLLSTHGEGRGTADIVQASAALAAD